MDPTAVEDTSDPVGGDGLFKDLTDASDGVGLSCSNSKNGTVSSSWNIKSIVRGANERA